MIEKPKGSLRRDNTACSASGKAAVAGARTVVRSVNMLRAAFLILLGLPMIYFGVTGALFEHALSSLSLAVTGIGLWASAYRIALGRSIFDRQAKSPTPQTGHDIDRPSRAAPSDPFRPSDESSANSDFDADGIIARYLAEKAQREAEPEQIAAPRPISGGPQRSFGRKGL